MPKIDWHALYAWKTGGNLVFSKSKFEELKLLERPFISLVKKYVPEGGRILDAGCGLGRACMLLSLAGYKMTGVDKDRRMLAIARRNVSKFGGKARFALADLTLLPFKRDSFDAITHQGILEHYYAGQAKAILAHHLKIAPLVIFSVPIKSPHTSRYFSSDRFERNIRSVGDWKRTLGKFHVLALSEATQRTHNMIAVISR
ncbi:MAG TPA: class I SAM-dependent methyltransferase [Candidatus Norongarragalinales archaeon]|nr:class I SAM-dependent methyltransferase [Candidatus Norongarragalinales archaeon]